MAILGMSLNMSELNAYDIGCSCEGGNMPKYSFIILTYNEEESIGGVLKSISVQRLRDFEIIVVDDNSADDTREIVKDFNAKLLIPDPPRTKTSRGRNFNLGVSVSQGDFLVFLSGHSVLPDKNWLSEVDNFIAVNSLDYMSCPSIPPPHLQILLNRYSLHDLRSALSRLASLDRKGFSGAGCVVNTAKFESVGGFPERIVSSEDIALHRKLQECGCRYAFARDLCTYHIDPKLRTVKAWIRRNFWEAFNSKIVDRKRLFLAAFPFVGLMTAAYSLFLPLVIFACYLVMIFGYWCLLSMFVQAETQKGVSPLLTVSITLVGGLQAIVMAFATILGALKRTQMKLRRKRRNVKPCKDYCGL